MDIRSLRRVGKSLNIKNRNWSIYKQTPQPCAVKMGCPCSPWSTHAHGHTHTRIFTRTQAHAPTNLHSRAATHPYAYVNTNTCIYVLAFVHVRTILHIHSHLLARKHSMYTYIRECTENRFQHNCIRTHACAYMRTHVVAHVHMRTQT